MQKKKSFDENCKGLEIFFPSVSREIYFKLVSQGQWHMHENWHAYCRMVTVELLLWKISLFSLRKIMM